MVSILLADDHRLVRAGLKMLINNESDMQVSCEADHVEEMVSLALERQPDVIVMNLHVSKMKILNAIEKINGKNSKIKMIVVSAYDVKEYALQFFHAGASGYLLKSKDDPQLIEAIRTVNRGDVYCQLCFVTKWKDMRHSNVIKRTKILTSREEEVLTNIALGYTNQEIADQLFLSVKTIETHRAKMMEKLKLKSRSELVQYAIKHGYLDFVYERFYNA